MLECPPHNRCTTINYHRATTRANDSEQIKAAAVERRELTLPSKKKLLRWNDASLRQRANNDWLDAASRANDSEQMMTSTHLRRSHNRMRTALRHNAVKCHTTLGRAFHRTLGRKHGSQHFVTYKSVLKNATMLSLSDGTLADLETMRERTTWHVFRLVSISFKQM